jgi:hypothetical protein
VKEIKKKLFFNKSGTDMIVKVVGDVEAKNEYGYVGAIPSGEYEVTVDGMVFFEGYCK